MKFPTPLSLQQVADIINAKVIGDPTIMLEGTNEINRVEKGDIAFAEHPKYFDKALQSAATAAIVNQEVEAPEGKGVLVVEKPFEAFNALNLKFGPTIHSYTAIDHSSFVGEGTYIAQNVVLGANVKVGANCQIMPGVVIYQNTEIGNNVIIHANTVIGGDAFYYNKKDGRYQKMHTCGKVVLENDVEIGANCTIDRGVTAITKIGSGTKIDNQVHIGHDTVIGSNCLFAGQSAIAGCVTIGNEVVVWGNCAIASRVIVEDRVEILAYSGVSKNLKQGKKYWGAPADEARAKFKEVAVLKKLAKG